MAEFDTVRRADAGVRTAEIDAGLRAHMNKVYGLMSMAMIVTGAVAWGFGADVANFVNNRPTSLIPAGMIETIFFSPVKYVVMFAPLIMIFTMGAMVNKLSESALQLFFYTFSAVMGLSISWIFAAYTGMSIAQTFFVTAIAFAGLSLWGYTTKKDISGWGSFLIMGVIGLIIAAVVNLFLQSPAIMFAISGLGVLIFAGLTAYDTQRIKNEYLMMRGGGEAYMGKAAIMGAVSLYINFINLFMFLLSFLGNRE